METKIITKNGNPYFNIDGSDYVPAAFRSFRPTPANVSLFHRSDVKLYQFLISGQLTGMDIPYSLYPPVWVEENEYDFEALDVQIDLFRRFAPDGKLWVFFQFDTPREWIKRDDTISDSFFHLEAAYFDERWKSAAEAYARALVSYCEEKYGDLVFAYAFSAGRSCEWFLNSVEPVETPEKLAAWREYLGDPTAMLPKLSEIQSYSLDHIEPTATTDGILRSHSDLINQYHRFMKKVSGETVCRFAGAIQEVLCHRKPIGTFYGYSNSNCSDPMPVFISPDIDMIFSPAAYDKYRKLGGTSGHQLPISSLALHGKLYLYEIDHRTPLANFPLEAPVAEKPMAYRLNKYRLINDCYDTEEETVEVLRRELGTVLSVGGSLWWFDFFGGYYATPTLEGEVKRQVAIMERFKESKFDRVSLSEIAVFLDQSAPYCVREDSGVLRDFIFESLYEIAKIGAPYDYYYMDDLKKIDISRYKLFIFPNAMGISDEDAQWIKNNLSDRYKIWVYAPGYVCDSFSIERMNELTGIRVERFSVKNQAMPVFTGGSEFSFTKPVSPMFRVSDSSAEIIGTYENGDGAAAVKDRSVYFAVPKVPAAALRKIAERAGVHMYTEAAGGALSVSSQMIAYQTTETEDIALTLPHDGIYEEMFHGGRYKTENGKLCYRAPSGEARLFMRL